MKIKDIANIAKVSPSTVSMVINNKKGVGNVTRQHVLSVLNQYGYKLPDNKEVRNERGSIRFLQFKNHGMVVDRNQPFFANVIDAIEREATNQGYRLLMTTMTNENIEEVIRLIKTEQTDGIILMGTELSNDDLVYFDQIKEPIVIVDNNLEFANYDCVVANNIEIAYRAVQYLWDIGHKNIGYLHSSMTTNNFSDRRFGYMRAIKNFGLSYNEDNVYLLSPTPDGAYLDMKKYLQQGTKLPTALFADNDTIAIGAMKALKEFNIQIPNDVSVIGFDNIPFCTMVEPPLTTMHINKGALGEWSIRRLIEKIDNVDNSIIKIQFGADLIVRDSTCPFSEKK